MVGLSRLALAVSVAAVLAGDVQAKPKYEYENVSRTCTKSAEIGVPPKVKIEWVTEQICTKISAETSAGSFAYEAAVLVPDTYPAPVVITDEPDTCGLPLVVNGVVVEFAPSASVEAKVSALYPPDSGQRWFGFESTEEIPPSPASAGLCSISATSCTSDDDCPGETCDDPDPGEVRIKMIYQFDEIPTEDADFIGAEWFSNDSDDRFGDLVVDSFTLLDPDPRFLPALSPGGRAVCVLIVLGLGAVLSIRRSRVIGCLESRAG